MRSHVASDGHKLLLTRYGRFDLLGHVAPALRYEDVSARSVPFDIDGVTIRVVDLPMLIELKRACGRATSPCSRCSKVRLTSRSEDRAATSEH